MTSMAPVPPDLIHTAQQVTTGLDHMGRLFPKLALGDLTTLARLLASGEVSPNPNEVGGPLPDAVQPTRTTPKVDLFKLAVAETMLNQSMLVRDILKMVKTPDGQDPEVWLRGLLNRDRATFKRVSNRFTVTPRGAQWVAKVRATHPREEAEAEAGEVPEWVTLARKRVPRVAILLYTLMGDEWVTAEEARSLLEENGCSPDSTDPRRYVQQVLIWNETLFERMSQGNRVRYRRRKTAPSGSVTTSVRHSLQWHIAAVMGKETLTPFQVVAKLRANGFNTTKATSAPYVAAILSRQPKVFEEVTAGPHPVSSTFRVIHPEHYASV